MSLFPRTVPSAPVKEPLLILLWLTEVARWEHGFWTSLNGAYSNAALAWLIETARWERDLWLFLNKAHSETSWMHTLLDGLVSALIGAAAALLVLWVTIKAQNRGIRQQIRAQTDGLNEQLKAQGLSLGHQLSEQRRENARTREHEAATQIIAALTRLLRGDPRIDQDATPSSAVATTILEITTGSQRLRLDLAKPDEAFTSAFDSWVYWLESVANRHRELVTKSLAPEQADIRLPLELQGTMGELHSIARFMVKYLVLYIQADDARRAGMGAVIREALASYHEHNGGGEFYDRYMRAEEESQPAAAGSKSG